MKIGGKEYKIKFDLYTWDQYEKNTGKSFTSIGEAKVGDLITLAHCAIERGEKDNDFSLTRDQVFEHYVDWKPAELVIHLAELFNHDQEEKSEKK